MDALVPSLATPCPTPASAAGAPIAMHTSLSTPWLQQHQRLTGCLLTIQPSPKRTSAHSLHLSHDSDNYEHVLEQSLNMQHA